VSEDTTTRVGEGQLADETRAIADMRTRWAEEFGATTGRAPRGWFDSVATATRRWSTALMNSPGEPSMASKPTSET